MVAECQQSTISAIEYLDSSKSSQIQVAGIFAYLYGRQRIEGNRQSLRTPRRLWNQLRPLVRTGEIKVWPRRDVGYDQSFATRPLCSALVI